MKIHLAWIRVAAAAAIVASAGVYPAAAQYAPYRPIPQTPPAPVAAPAAAPAVAPPTTPYVAYRPQPAYQSPVAQYQPAPAAQYPQYQAPTARYQAPAAPVAQYQQPAAQYQQPVAQHQQPTAQYQQTVTPYPQTASQYPTGGAYAYVAQAAPTEALPAPAQATSPGPGNGNGPGPDNGNGQVMPSAEGMPADPVAPGASGYPAAGCAGGGYPATTGNYTANGCGCNGAYPEISQYMAEPCNDNQWFGGVYFLYMTREHSNDVRLTTEIETGTVTYPYYPPASTTVVSSQSLNSDFAPGVEVRFGSTFTIGDSCNTCQNSCGYTSCGGSGGCGSCQSCRQPTMYAWEVAAWGLDNDSNDYVRQDTIDTRLYGLQSFAGIQTDRDNDGSYVPVNNYYDYQMPIDPQPGDTLVLAQRVYTNFRAQNLELNIIRFPMVCDTGCSSCGTDACGGCGSNYSGCNSGCGCDDGWNTNFSMYGSCGVRYFRTDDDFGYDSEFEVVGDGHAYDGFSGMPDLNEMCYDINIDNNLIGPQVGWTSNYCIGCRWNFFCNSTFGVFDNQINQTQRVWGSGDTVFVNSGENVDVRSHKNDVAFLGELRVGGSYDFSCHWRGVLAYRAIGLSGIATSVGQIPSNFSNRAEIAQIDSDSSMIIHGVQTGVECRY